MHFAATQGAFNATGSFQSTKPLDQNLDVWKLLIRDDANRF
jgi:hypothetical protein